MDDLISRESVIEIIESVCSADDSYWQPGTLEKIRNLPTHPTPSNTLGALDYVDRKNGKVFPVEPISYLDCSNAMLKMWMDNVVTDGEYNRIIDKLNKKHEEDMRGENE